MANIMYVLGSECNGQPELWVACGEQPEGKIEIIKIFKGQYLPPECKKLMGGDPYIIRFILQHDGNRTANGEEIIFKTVK